MSSPSSFASAQDHITDEIDESVPGGSYPSEIIMAPPPATVEESVATSHRWIIATFVWMDTLITAIQEIVAVLPHPPRRWFTAPFVWLDIMITAIFTGDRRIGYTVATICMIASQMQSSLGSVLFRMASDQGARPTIVVAQRMVFGLCVAIPQLIYSLRSPRTKPITWTLIGLIFLQSVFWVAMQFCYYIAIASAPATIVSAMWNISPFLTLVLSRIFGFEQCLCRQRAFWVKLCGMVIITGSAVTTTFYSGFVVELHYPHPAPLRHPHANDIPKGVIFAFFTSLSYGLYLMTQEAVGTRSPSASFSTSLVGIFGVVPSVIVALVVERHHLDQWAPHFDHAFGFVFYSVFVSTLIFGYLTTRISTHFGSEFISLFTSAGLPFTAALSYLMLGEKILMGSIYGAVGISFGSGLALWGKSKERLTPPREPDEDAV